MGNYFWLPVQTGDDMQGLGPLISRCRCGRQGLVLRNPPNLPSIGLDVSLVLCSSGVVTLSGRDS